MLVQPEEQEVGKRLLKELFGLVATRVDDGGNAYIALADFARAFGMTEEEAERDLRTHGQYAVPERALRRRQ